MISLFRVKLHENNTIPKISEFTLMHRSQLSDCFQILNEKCVNYEGHDQKLILVLSDLGLHDAEQNNYVETMS